jgi:glutamate N-acetyltransferase/amino-acid N-acetyltransferase
MEEQPLPPKGFLSIQANVGLKEEGDDFLLVKSIEPAVSSAVFTQSLFPGASVELSKESQFEDGFQGLVVISKNANVATGENGYKHALEVRALASEILKIPEESVLIASTGVIGREYPMDKMRAEIPRLDGKLLPLNPSSAASAIMTTDTTYKVSSVKCGESTIVGIAKGVGMVEPNMATLLSFFFTDAHIEKEDLNIIFKSVIGKTFNSLSIDTDTSTSDTAAIFANGLSGKVQHDDFEKSLYQCALELTKKIAIDGEGATKSIIVNVTGATDDRQAKRVGKSVVNSPLVKTAVHGKYPNWGRVIMAIGKLDDELNIKPSLTKVSFGKYLVFPFTHSEKSSSILSKVKNYLEEGEIEINIDLGINDGSWTVYGCDLSDGYIKINADYTT